MSYRLGRRWYTGHTHVTLEPVAFLSRLATLIPPPRVHLTRFHSVFAPPSKLRSAVVARVPGAEHRDELVRGLFDVQETLDVESVPVDSKLVADMAGHRPGDSEPLENRDGVGIVHRHFEVLKG